MAARGAAMSCFPFNFAHLDVRESTKTRRL